jgi:hypothetical protein
LDPHTAAIVQAVLVSIGGAIRAEIRQAIREEDAARAEELARQKAERDRHQRIVKEREQWQRRIDTLLSSAKTVGTRPRANERQARVHARH